MGRVTYLRNSPPRLAGALIWAVALISFCWILVDIAVSGFARTATFLPLAACAGLLLAIYATLLRPGRRFGKTLALYVIAAAVVGVSVVNDLLAGAPLAAVAGLGGVMICCWLSAGLLIFARPRKGATEPAAAPPARRAWTVAAGAGVVAAVVVAACALFLPPLSADRSTAEAATPAVVPGSVTAARWRSAEGSFLDYPDRLIAAGTGYLVSQATAVTAYDGATGAQRWHFAVDQARGFSASASADGSTVVLVYRPGINAAVADSATRLVSLDAVTGQTRWARWLGGSLPPIVSITDTEIWLGAAEETPALAALQRINRISLADGTDLGPVDLDNGAACTGSAVSTAVAGRRILEMSRCDGTLRLRSVVPGTTGDDAFWTQDLGDQSQSELLTSGGTAQVGALGSLRASRDSAVVFVPMVESADGVNRTVSGPSKVFSAEGAELFGVPADERPIRVVDTAVITWKAGLLKSYPLDGSTPFVLTGTASCQPDENSAMASLGATVLASCADGTALGSFTRDATPTAVDLGLEAGADLWVSAVPGAVVVYDSISGTTVGLD